MRWGIDPDAHDLDIHDLIDMTEVDNGEGGIVGFNKFHKSEEVKDSTYILHQSWE